MDFMSSPFSANGSTFLNVGSVNIPHIKGIPDSDMVTVQQLLAVWSDKYPRNLIRSKYVDAHESLKDFGISIPDSIKAKSEAMIGWPAKAVRSLADLSVFEGFSTSGETDSFDVARIVEDNALDTVVPGLVSSAYTHSCSFLTVTTGDDGRVFLMPRSADWSAAIWDRQQQRIKAALTITDDDRYGSITAFNVWLDDKVYVCDGHTLPWQADAYYNPLGRPPVVALSYDAQLNRPFGRSRVSRPLMALTDIGFRTIVRMEASAEFYAVPKLWFLGASEDAFSADTWSSLISAINAISKDEDGGTPTLHQVTQASMQPHSDMLKTIALMVASETNIPVSDLGVTMDNPASAEAMAAAERKLSREADRQNKRFGRALKEAVIMGVRLRDNLKSTPDGLSAIRPVWAPTREVSDAARADSFSKIASVSQEFAQTEVGWRYAGFDQQDVTTILNRVRQAEASSTLDKLIGASNDNQSTGQPVVGGAEAGGAAGAARNAVTVANNTGNGSDMAA
jgi:hypothetical protein